MGDDAIRTIGVTAILNFQESTGVAMKRIKGDFRKEPFFLNVTDLRPWKITFLHRGKIIRDPSLFPVSQQIMYTFHLQQGIRIHLRVASGDNDQGVRIGSGGPSNHLPRLKIGPVGDGARIDNGDVRTFFERDDSIPSLFEGVDQSLGLELVHLASERSNGNSRHSIRYYLSRTMKPGWSSSRLSK
jgi:hypothetical protein